MKSSGDLAELFRSKGLKVTPQRLAVFDALRHHGDHPTAEAIYESVAEDLPTISLRTVYQTLNDLTSMNELGVLDVGTGSTRFDTVLDSHHHLVCEGCGKVADVHTEFTDVQVPEQVADGFTVSATEIVFRGRCDACRTAGSPTY